MNYNISAYCNKKIVCSCGRAHFCPIENVTVENGALKTQKSIARNMKGLGMPIDQIAQITGLTEGEIIDL